MKAYRIRHKETGLFYSGTSYGIVNWSKVGKLYGMLQHVRAAMKLRRDPFRKPYTLADVAEIVEYELRPVG